MGHAVAPARFHEAPGTNRSAEARRAPGDQSIRSLAWNLQAVDGRLADVGFDDCADPDELQDDAAKLALVDERMAGDQVFERKKALREQPGDGGIGAPQWKLRS